MIWLPSLAFFRLFSLAKPVKIGMLNDRPISELWYELENNPDV
jgi:hypothetical protein